MRFVTKTTPIGYIDSKCHIKNLKSSKTCLIGYSGLISCQWLLMASGADTHTWFKNLYIAKNKFMEVGT